MEDAAYTPRHLVLVETGCNHNKYYDMTPCGDTWTARFGRVGSGGAGWRGEVGGGAHGAGSWGVAAAGFMGGQKAARRRGMGKWSPVS